MPSDPTAAALADALSQLIASLEALQSARGLAALKQPGVSPETALPPNTADTPIYVSLPAEIEIVNLAPADCARVLANVPVTADAAGHATLTIALPPH